MRPKIDPCGTPNFIILFSNVTLDRVTYCFPLLIKLVNRVNATRESYIFPT